MLLNKLLFKGMYFFNSFKFSNYFMDSLFLKKSLNSKTGVFMAASGVTI
jgi:hypothetical protein